MLADFLSYARVGEELSGRDATAVELIEVSDSSYQPDGITVISSVRVDLSSASEKGALLAVTPSGKVVHEDRSYNIYDDVDPSPSGRYTVSYLSVIVLQGADCQSSILSDVH